MRPVRIQLAPFAEHSRLYGACAGGGRYRIILSTDDLRYGGQGRNDRSVAHFSFPVTDDEGVTRHYIKVYNICRTAVVYKIIR